MAATMWGFHRFDKMYTLRKHLLPRGHVLSTREKKLLALKGKGPGLQARPFTEKVLIYPATVELVNFAVVVIVQIVPPKFAVWVKVFVTYDPNVGSQSCGLFVPLVSKFVRQTAKFPAGTETVAPEPIVIVCFKFVLSE